MSGSRTIRVLKQDGSTEGFDPAKLAGALSRAMRARGEAVRDANELALAIHIYLRRRRRPPVSSGAIFEMSINVLRRVGMSSSARRLEGHRTWRSRRRGDLRIRHPGGQVTCWEKGWLVQLCRRGWGLSQTTARIVAGQVEAGFLAGGDAVIRRRDIQQRLNELVAAYGLADAVPVQMQLLRRSTSFSRDRGWVAPRTGGNQSSGILPL